MLIVIPASKADHSLAIALATQILDNGGCRPHPIMLAISKSCPPESAQELESLLSKATTRLHLFRIPSTDERGWPVSANAVFHDVAFEVFRQRCYGEKCWYFMEADNTILRPDWADKLEYAYLQHAKPYLGVIQATIRTITPKDGGEPKREQHGQHMVGTGIYPANFFNACRLAKHLPKTKIPFDVYIQDEILPQVAHTALIQHNWQTCNYRREGRDIVCDPTEKYELGAIANPVQADAVVLHGCKDGSLAMLLDTESR